MNQSIKNRKKLVGRLVSKGEVTTKVKGWVFAYNERGLAGVGRGSRFLGIREEKTQRGQRGNKKDAKRGGD